MKAIQGEGNGAKMSPSSFGFGVEALAMDDEVVPLSIPPEPSRQRL